MTLRRRTSRLSCAELRTGSWYRSRSMRTSGRASKIAYRQRYGKESEGDHAEREADKSEIREHQKAQEHHGARTWEYKHPNLSKEERVEHSKKWNEHHQAEIDAEQAYQKKYAGTNQFKEGDVVKNHAAGYTRGAVGKVTKVQHHPKYGTHYQVEWGVNIQSSTKNLVVIGVVSPRRFSVRLARATNSRRKTN